MAVKSKSKSEKLSTILNRLKMLNASNELTELICVWEEKGKKYHASLSNMSDQAKALGMFEIGKAIYVDCLNCNVELQE